MGRIWFFWILIGIIFCVGVFLLSAGMTGLVILNMGNPVFSFIGPILLLFALIIVFFLIKKF